MNTAIIILAAGNSSRLGKPKQLLKYKEQTLLQIVTDAAMNTQFHPVIVVLGAYANEIKALHNHPKVVYVINEQWESGMSSSIAVGINKVLNDFPETENAIITVADQAHITANVFTALLEKHQTENKSIVTSSYSKTTGTPTLFNKKYFDKLINLQGSVGAKELIKQNIVDTASVPFELGSIDIDTESDYNNLINYK
ncbi:nucleotidyltransferase family protein [Pedobacter jejuensis]|uniref:Nucleotidyltransferase family protein n=1 Tax=Pedobacter jejuensis TaxID=1268550 RepID=A0A3N0C0H2_9SPHI|nr:nucleotidyltransferase family protein [Pedobacter jejuensis]RNL55769.1 nucleotidyltransferase family protein [Pedobacter jejuensis]